MAEKLNKWLPIVKESALILLALAGLYFGLKAQDDATTAAFDKHIAVQTISEAEQNGRLDRLERIAERQEDLIRSLDRLVAKLDK